MIFVGKHWLPPIMQVYSGGTVLLLVQISDVVACRLLLPLLIGIINLVLDWGVNDVERDWWGRDNLVIRQNLVIIITTYDLALLQGRLLVQIVESILNVFLGLCQWIFLIFTTESLRSYSYFKSGTLLEARHHIAIICNLRLTLIHLFTFFWGKRILFIGYVWFQQICFLT